MNFKIFLYALKCDPFLVYTYSYVTGDIVFKIYLFTLHVHECWPSCMYGHHMCVWYTWMPEGYNGSLGSGVADGCETPCRH